MNDHTAKYRIAYIAAGAAGMYCGSCIHDNALARGIRHLGHDIALIPTYTPLRTDEDSESIDRVFYNGVSVYLEQKIPFFRNHTGFWDRLLDSKLVVNYLARLNASTNARDLGELTVSMLEGEHGHQRKELFKLIDWLQAEYQPDIVQLTNSMLAGMAREIRQRLQVPVLCALQGEDIFLEDLIEPFKTRALDILRERVRDIDGFVVTSDYYADFMAGYLDIPREKLHTVHLGINPQGYSAPIAAQPAGDKPFVIGYLARICPEKGLHL
ncbi:MAG TPA: glycosyltransferase, partial [Calditrichia bacterium]|nr:glycosyltransferase [Calditrichia bacterium]